MRYTAIILILILLTGCTQKYIIPAGCTRTDFIIDREECADEVGYPQTDWFLFGPVIILVPIFLGYLGYKYYKGMKFQECMESKGYIRK